MKQPVDTVRLPSGEDTVAPVRILDAEGRVVRILSAEEFRRDYSMAAHHDSSRPTVRVRRH